MNIYILTEGGTRIGRGHISRCVSLCEAFQERGIRPVLLIHGDASVSGWIARRKDYRLYPWRHQRRRLSALLRSADAVIVDSYLADPDYYTMLSERVNVCAYIDDYQRIRYPRGIIINGSIYGAQLDYPATKDASHLLGPRYIPLRKEFWSMPVRRIQRDVRTILLTFGGLEQKRLTGGIAELLRKAFRSARVYATGNNRSARAMRSLMTGADLCICGCGQTTYEAARCGLPFVGIRFADNQDLNIQGWRDTGAMKFAGDHRDTDLFAHISGVLRDLTCEERARMSRSGRRCVDGKGARRIVSAVVGLLR